MKEHIIFLLFKKLTKACKYPVAGQHEQQIVLGAVSLNGQIDW